jgi:thioredoxin 1
MSEIIKFEKNGCVPCVRVSNLLEENNVEYKAINIMIAENGDLLEKYGIFSVPVTILLNDEGKVVKEVTGFDEVGLIEIINMNK